MYCTQEMKKLDIHTYIQKLATYINEQDWSKNEKMRFGYLALGEYVYKNVDFFLSLYRKLNYGERNLNNAGYEPKEVKEKYYTTILSQEVLCTSACHALQELFYKIGLANIMVKTTAHEWVNGNEYGFDLYHYFIACRGDNDAYYFMELVPDLSYIQMGMATHYFANDVAYLKKDKDGKEYETYQLPDKNNHYRDLGPLEHQVLTKNELAKIDEKLGYLKTKYPDRNKNNPLFYEDESLNMLKAAYAGNKEYYRLLEEDDINPFFRQIKEFTNSNHEKKSLIDTNLTLFHEDDWLCLAKKIMRVIITENHLDHELIASLLSEPTMDSFYSTYLKWAQEVQDKNIFSNELLNYLSSVMHNIDEAAIHHTKTMEEEKELIKMIPKWFYEQIKDYLLPSGKQIKLNTENIVDKKDWLLWMNDVCKKLQSNSGISIQQTITNEKDIESWFKKMREELAKRNTNVDYTSLLNTLEKLFQVILNQAKNVKTKSIIQVLDKIALEFVNPKMLANPDDITDEYIATKFALSFQSIFDCGQKTAFSELHYGEQLTMFTKAIEAIFPEVTYQNSHLNQSDYPKKSAILNRIHIIAIKNIQTHQYEVLFQIGNHYNYVYQPQKNILLSNLNSLDIISSYAIASSQVKLDSVNELEDNIEQNKRI